MNQKQPLQPVDEIQRNALGLPTVSAKEICGLLDTLVSSLSVQFHQYLKHHWVVEGPEHRDLHLFFEDSYEEVKENMDAIAERMTALGAVPSSDLTSQASKSFLESEQEGAMPVRAMLENDMKNEQTLISNLRDSIQTANELSDYGTETLLKQTLLKREERTHELEHYLSRDSLSKSETEEGSLA